MRIILSVVLRYLYPIQLELSVAIAELTNTSEPQKKKRKGFILACAKNSELTELSKRAIAIQGVINKKRRTIRTMIGLINEAHFKAATYRIEIRAEAGRLDRLIAFLQSFNTPYESDDDDDDEEPAP